MITMMDLICSAPDKITEKLNDADWEKPLCDFLKQRKKNLKIIASGSSYHAAACASAVMEEILQCEIEIIYPYTFTGYKKIKEDADYILISQSGNSMNTLMAAKKLQENQIPFHMITDNRSITDQEGMSVTHLEVYNEAIPFVTIGFDLTVLMLIKAAYAVIGKPMDELVAIPEYMHKSIAKGHQFFDENKDWLRTVKRIHICADGANEYCAKEAALKFCETLQIAASGYELEEFMHGGFLELEEDHAVFLIASPLGQPRAKQLQKHLPELCSHVFLFEEYDIDPLLQPLCHIPLFQCLAAHMNAMHDNPLPMMKKKYVEFEKKMKSKKIAYYEEEII